jgi:hypothetical protein
MVNEKTYHLPLAVGKGTPPSRRRRIFSHAIFAKFPLLLEGGVPERGGRFFRFLSSFVFVV